MLTCPRCGCDRNDNDARCPVCGVDFEYEDKLRLEREKRQRVAKDGEERKSDPKPSASPTKTTNIHIPFTACPKCGFDRDPDQLQCPMCNADFVFLARIEMEKQIRKGRNQAVGVVAPGSTAIPAGSPSSFSERPAAGILIGKCPQCGNSRMSSFTRCPGCGSLFDQRPAMVIDNRDVLSESPSQKASDGAVILGDIADYEAELSKAEARKTEDRKSSEPEKRSSVSDSLREFIRLFRNIGVALVEDSKSASGVMRNTTQQGFRNTSQRLTGEFSKVRRKRLIVLVSAGVILGGAAYLAPGFLGSVRERESRKVAAELNQQVENTFQDVEQRRMELYERISREYDRYRNDIHQQLKSHVDNREFDLFEQAIRPYDIPPLEMDLADIKKYCDEITLSERVLKYPPEDHRMHYDAYVRLIELNPAKQEYHRRREQYAKKLADGMYEEVLKEFEGNQNSHQRLKTALALLDEAVALNPGDGKLAILGRDIKRQMLQFYEGNDHVLMAVRDDGMDHGRYKGQRKLYIWMKNIGESPFFPSLDYFTLIGVDGMQYKYNDSDRSLAMNIDPGKEIGGYLYFYTSVDPRAIVFDHHTAGKITREFPD